MHRQRVRRTQQVAAHPDLEPRLRGRGDPGQPAAGGGAEDVEHDPQPLAQLVASTGPPAVATCSSTRMCSCWISAMTGRYSGLVSEATRTSATVSRWSRCSARNSRSRWLVTRSCTVSPRGSSLATRRNAFSYRLREIASSRWSLDGKVAVERGQRDHRALGELLHLQRVFTAAGQHRRGHLQHSRVAVVLRLAWRGSQGSLPVALVSISSSRSDPTCGRDRAGWRRGCAAARRRPGGSWPPSPRRAGRTPTVPAR